MVFQISEIMNMPWIRHVEIEARVLKNVFQTKINGATWELVETILEDITLLSAELSLRRPALNLNLTEIQNLIDVIIELINANYFYQ